jgi:GTPase SAR1 family protein
MDLPLDGHTLVVGPSNVGKTRYTADALIQWVDEHGPSGCVILDFAPTIERDGTVLGGQLTRFIDVPDGVYHGVVDAHAPRSESDTETEAIELAAENERDARDRLDDAPEDPRAVFVNDITIALQAHPDTTSAFTEYFDRADVVVCNAFESDELGSDDRISRNEQTALETLHEWADRRITLQ